MKIAYVFANDMAATYKLSSMILPQLEADSHIVQVVGMFFFDDNIFSLRKGDPVGAVSYTHLTLPTNREV